MSAIRYPTYFVQPTHHAGVDCSVFFARRSVDTSRCHRLFGIIRYAFSRHSRLSGIFCASSIRFPAALGAQLIHKPQYLHGDDRGHGDEGDHAEAVGDEVVSGRCAGGALDEGEDECRCHRSGCDAAGIEGDADEHFRDENCQCQRDEVARQKNVPELDGRKDDAHHR